VTFEEGAGGGAGVDGELAEVSGRSELADVVQQRGGDTGAAGGGVGEHHVDVSHRVDIGEPDDDTSLFGDPRVGRAATVRPRRRIDGDPGVDLLRVVVRGGGDAHRALEHGQGGLVRADGCGHDGWCSFVMAVMMLGKSNLRVLLVMMTTPRPRSG
jgi:hypothetical protein